MRVVFLHIGTASFCRFKVPIFACVFFCTFKVPIFARAFFADLGCVFSHINKSSNWRLIMHKKHAHILLDTWRPIHLFHIITSLFYFAEFVKIFKCVIDKHAPLKRASRKQRKLIQKPLDCKGIFKSIKNKQKLLKSHFLQGTSGKNSKIKST